jgi:hypothetical protein
MWTFELQIKTDILNKQKAPTSKNFYFIDGKNPPDRLHHATKNKKRIFFQGKNQTDNFAIIEATSIS